MPWVKVIDEDEATGQLARAYRHIRKARGKIGNVVKITGLLPKVTQSNLDLYVELMYGEHALPRTDRELVAVEVSRANCTDYCLHHHSAALARVLGDEGEARRFMEAGTLASITPRQEAMLAYARKLATAPQEVRRSDVEAMQRAGLTDEEIVAVNHIVGYFSLMNRVVMGLGVELEADKGADPAYRY